MCGISVIAGITEPSEYCMGNRTHNITADWAVDREFLAKVVCLHNVAKTLVLQGFPTGLFHHCLALCTPIPILFITCVGLRSLYECLFIYVLRFVYAAL